MRTGIWPIKVVSSVVETDGTTMSAYFAHKAMAEETEHLLPAKGMSRSELDTESGVIALDPSRLAR
jgi:hypothetical protein